MIYFIDPSFSDSNREERYAEFAKLFRASEDWGWVTYKILFETLEVS